MEYKVVAVVAAVFVLFESAHSLRCYSCSSLEPDQSCASPIDTGRISSIECNRTSTRNLHSYFSTPIDIEPNLLREADNATKYQCISYEKIYKSNNKTETIRSCVQKVTDFCKFLQGAAELEGKHNLTKCHTCDTENCNSGTSLHVSTFLFISLILGVYFKS